MRDLRRSARAPAARIAGPSARTRVHRADERELRRERHRSRGARDHDATVLERLAQRVEDMARDLLQLVEKQHAVMREAHFAGARLAAAADEAGRRKRMVRRAERTAYAMPRH